MRVKNDMFGRFFKRLNVRDNKKGNILSVVVVIGAALFITTLAILSTVNGTTEVKHKVENGENAYLAARSGMRMLVDAGKDSSFASKLVNAAGNSTPIKMNLGEFGNCDIKVSDLKDASLSDGTVYKTAQVECTGNYEGSSFKLTRFLKFKQTGTENKSELKTNAYTHYGDGDVNIAGGIEGDVIIIGEGKVTSSNATGLNKMHKVVCSNEIDLTNSGCTYELIAAGKHLTLRDATIETEIYVGSNKYVDNKFTDELNDNIFFGIGNESQTTVNSFIRCEGVTVIGGTTDVNKGFYDGDIEVDMGGSPDAVISGGDTYIGYRVKDPATYAPGNGYKDPTSTVDTSVGLQKYNDCQNIYGNVVSGGNVVISGTGTIYGDIICNKNVIIQDNCAIKGNIYAAGDVIFESGVSCATSAMFPNGSASTINLGGNVLNSAANIKESELVISKSTPVPMLGNYFDGSDYVKAAEYFSNEYSGSPKPNTNIPAYLNTLEALTPGYTIVPTYRECTGCNDLSFYEQSTTEKCTTAWSGVCNPTNFPSYYLNGWQHIEHFKWIHKNHSVIESMTKVPVGGGDVSGSQEIHITTSTKLTGDFLLDHQGDKIYIDTSETGDNIDILLEGTITLGNAAGIYVNDNGGENQVRLFMTEGSGIKMAGTWGGTYPNFYVVSDAHKDVDISGLPQQITSDVYDVSKVPQFYVFGEQGKSNINIDLGNYGYLPGYILMPDVSIKGSTTAHSYIGGSIPGRDPNNPTNKSTTNYPFFYGMVMCNSFDFEATGAQTFVKYDTRLDPPDGSTEKSEVRKKFDSALKRDNVMFYDDDDDDSDGGGGTPGSTKWIVDSCY